jgi:hypothetical protein
LRSLPRGSIVSGMTLEFDINRTFDQNAAEFRKHLEGLDADCAKLLFENQATLLGDGNPARAQANRIAFNEAVLAQLKALPRKTEAT